MVTEKYDASYIPGEDYLDFLPKSGRAVVFPIYKSTFERRDEIKPGTSHKQPAMCRDHVFLWSKDLGRSLDYLETRKDVDRTKLAYLGASWGAELAPMFLAVEDRFKAAILQSGGIRGRHLPEVEALELRDPSQDPGPHAE